MMEVHIQLIGRLAGSQTAVDRRQAPSIRAMTIIAITPSLRTVLIIPRRVRARASRMTANTATMAMVTTTMPNQ